MFVNVKNENYGYAVATYGDYIAVANISNDRWTSVTSSLYRTGSVDYFRYNKSTDSHDFIETIYKNPVIEDVYLITEDNNSSPSGPNFNIDTENSFDILADTNDYTASFENGFGLSLDLYQKLLAVGIPYYKDGMIFSSTIFAVSGSSVEIHDLGKSEFTALSSSTYAVTIPNPDADVTESFGRGVSINSSWLAIGSPYVSASRGMVYIYKNNSTGSNYSWEFYQKITGSSAGDLFGLDLKLNKQSGSYSQSLIVGCGNISSSKAYYFEMVNGSWINTYTFVPDTNTIYPLTFGPTPYQPTMNVYSGYGYAVSTFGPTVVIGAPRDRIVYEFSGSVGYNQGSVYVYEKCPTADTRFALALKTYGTSSILKNNLLGYSVDVTNKYAVAGIPKMHYDVFGDRGVSPCFIQGTLSQTTACTSSIDEAVLGQSLLLNKDDDNGWEIVNIYQKKKSFLSPYRAYGYDVSIADKSMVIGAPLFISGSVSAINVNYTASGVTVLDDIMGKSYIYNLTNIHDNFQVGNVFYRNGKVVVMTSGSSFDGLFYDPNDVDNYRYYLGFKSQHTFYEKQVVCTVDPGEFNVSTNPSAIVRKTSSFDINGNGLFDFQDVDILLRYMQYKNTSILGATVSTDWSSSLLASDDEVSLYNFYTTQNSYNATQTSQFASSSIVDWETVDTSMQTLLDFNQDNKTDAKDMNILWKYFSNRLTQENYSGYVTPACRRKLFSDVIDYINTVSQKNGIPYINPLFRDYDRMVPHDKTGSYLAPMATTIGLYNGLDLVAVAKLGTPIKIIPELPINFVVKMDY